jgi:uncharacterized membrane protein
MLPFDPILASIRRQSAVKGDAAKGTSEPKYCKLHEIAISWSLAVACFAIYAALSIRRHQQMLTTGYDLGIFEQGVRAYAGGHAPISTLKGPGFNLLGDHFSPILCTLAPFYRVWPSPVTLLVAQAALFALAVVPLSAWAYRSLGAGPAMLIGLGYGISWGIAQAVGFDFHEVCFAVPMLSCTAVAIGTERWRTAAASAIPLLLVKEDLGLTVAAVGFYIAWRGSRRLGLCTAAIGLSGSAIEILLLIPKFNPSGSFAYWDKLPVDESSPDSGIFDLLIHGPLDLVSPAIKIQTLLLLLIPTACLALRSPLILLCIPTLTWRFLSGNPMYWGTDAHYSSVLMPIIFAAFIDALIRIKNKNTLGSRWIPNTALAAGTAASLAMIPHFALMQLAQSTTWKAENRISAAHALLSMIPDGATVAASNRIVPQLTERCTVTVFGLATTPLNSEWIAADLVTPGWPISLEAADTELHTAQAHGYRVIARGGGFILLRRIHA